MTKPFNLMGLFERIILNFKGILPVADRIDSAMVSQTRLKTLAKMKDVAQPETPEAEPLAASKTGMQARNLNPAEDAAYLDLVDQIADAAVNPGPALPLPPFKPGKTRLASISQHRLAAYVAQKTEEKTEE